MECDALAAARAYLEALGGEEPDAVAALVAADFVNEHLGALGTGCAGRDEYRRRLPDFFATLPERSYELVDAVTQRREAGGDDVVVRYRLTATADGHPIDLDGMMWIAVRDGRITRRIDCWDGLTFLRQTGRAT